MKKAQELADMINGREYGHETTDEMVQFAKENSLMICTGYSDDNITLYGAFEEEVGLSSDKSFQVFKWGERYEWIIWGNAMEDIELDNNVLQDLACEAIQRFLEEKALWIKVKTDTNGYFFDMSDNDYPTFEILEDGEKYCIGCVVDLSVLNTETYGRNKVKIGDMVEAIHIGQKGKLVHVEQGLGTFIRENGTANTIGVNHLKVSD